jgi:glycosyltransferase involved in cell wall biosynthesis
MSLVRTVLYTAAHGGFNLRRIPLGGGAAVCSHLVEEWNRTRPFPFRLLSPSLLEARAPRRDDLVRYSELEYARFCDAFEHGTTEEILRHDPSKTLVLSNDVSEGPSFRLLADRGYRIYTIYHVDVADYFTAIYLHGALRTERATAFFRWIRRFQLQNFVPGVLRLVWEKQEDSVLQSKGLIVPSHKMKEVLRNSYPKLDPGRVYVIPWGVWPNENTLEEVDHQKSALRKLYPIPPGAAVLLTLSRISPEKGQERILSALALWEKQRDYPEEGVVLFVAGEPAYMRGENFVKRLRRLSSALHRTRVYFPGYVTGARKQALFELSDLYVFPSRHESYGLTLMEAMQAGLPVLAVASSGAEEVFQDAFGRMVPAGRDREVVPSLVCGLKELLADREELQRKGQAAAHWVRQQCFSKSAAQLADLLRSE